MALQLGKPSQRKFAKRSLERSRAAASFRLAVPLSCQSKENGMHPKPTYLGNCKAVPEARIDKFMRGRA